MGQHLCLLRFPSLFVCVLPSGGYLLLRQCDHIFLQLTFLSYFQYFGRRGALWKDDLDNDTSPVWKPSQGVGTGAMTYIGLSMSDTYEQFSSG